MKIEVLKAKRELISLIKETNNDRMLGKSRMRPISIDSAKVLLDILENIKEAPNWYCPYCNATNQDGWPYCISCETTPKPNK